MIRGSGSIRQRKLVHHLFFRSQPTVAPSVPDGFDGVDGAGCGVGADGADGVDGVGVVVFPVAPP